MLIFKKIMRILLAVFMIYAGVAHLTFQRFEFRKLVPLWLPQDNNFLDFAVFSSGIIEILFGVALLLLVKSRVKVGIALSIFLVIVFFGNLSQYMNSINAFGLENDTVRLVRLFFQPILILWTLWVTNVFNSSKKLSR